MIDHLHSVIIDTKRECILFGQFTIQDCIDGWEWSHSEDNSGSGVCSNPYEAIEASLSWLELKEHGEWLKTQDQSA